MALRRASGDIVAVADRRFSAAGRETPQIVLFSLFGVSIRFRLGVRCSNLVRFLGLPEGCVYSTSGPTKKGPPRGSVPTHKSVALLFYEVKGKWPQEGSAKLLVHCIKGKEGVAGS